MFAAAAVALFIEVHAADGTAYLINPNSIISMRGRGHSTQSLFAEGLNCLLNMSDGKHAAVRETCEEVFKMIDESQRE